MQICGRNFNNELIERIKITVDAEPTVSRRALSLRVCEWLGWLGGLSFSAAAWRVSARGQWIGWNDDARREKLQLVVCNSRFLIGPEVRVPNLASHVLAQCVKRLGQDWRQRYGYNPVLLETYVERDRFVGTCYQAANFIQVGETKGRGRQDRDNACAARVKDVYIYPLRDDAKAVLCRQSIPIKPDKSCATGPDNSFARDIFRFFP